jgi:hypothetical protein
MNRQQWRHEKSPHHRKKKLSYDETEMIKYDHNLCETESRLI